MASWKKALAIFLIYYVVLFVGAAIVMYLEARGLETETTTRNHTEPLARLLEKELSISVNNSILSKVIEMSQDIASKQNKEKDREWKRKISWSTLYRWRYFTHVTLTTLGYGNITPETEGGMIFLIIYGTIGIPINIIFITTIGSLLSKGFSVLIKQTEKRIFKIKNVRHAEIKTSLLLLLSCIVWLTIGALVNTSVMKWSWTEGFYAAFVRLSTIGYGDYLVKFDKVKWYGELIAWYTNIGLALAAGVFDALSNLMQVKNIKGKADENKLAKEVPEQGDTMGYRNEVLEMQDKEKKKKRAAYDDNYSMKAKSSKTGNKY